RRGAASSPDPDALPGNNLASSPDPAAHEPDPDSFNGEAILFFPMSLALRDEFLLDPEVVFLNHGSFGATPRPVFERYQAFQRELERQPVEFLGRRQKDLLTEARKALATYVGSKPDDLVFVPNVTT